MLTKTDELKDRISARKHELMAKYKELSADAGSEARDTASKLKARLDELEQHTKDGWDKMTDQVKTKLNEWLDRRDDAKDAKKS
jgi:hypothetical protein